MLAIGGGVHEIALKFTSLAYAQDSELPFWDAYSRHGNEALSWTEILPQLEAILKMSQINKYIMGIILFGVVVFGIVNTLFMSLYERMFEFGVLRAVGTRPFRMAQVVLFEAGALAIVSIGLGAALGCLVTAIFVHRGIDLYRHRNDGRDNAGTYLPNHGDSTVHPLSDMGLRIHGHCGAVSCSVCSQNVSGRRNAAQLLDYLLRMEGDAVLSRLQL